MGKKNKTTKKLDDNWEEIERLYKKGESLTILSQAFGVSRSTLSKRLKSKVLQASTANPTLHILLLDIENAPMMSYHWGVWKQNIGQPMRVEGDRSYMMSIALKWLGDDKVHYLESRTEDDSKLLKETIEFLDKADIVIAHNGKAFDVKKINTYALINNIKPPSPYRIIDTLIEARKHFMFERNTLAHLAEALDCSPKLEHSNFQGFELWKEYMKGNENAWAEMRLYNKQDVLTLEEVYLKMRPYIKGHPNVVTTAGSFRYRCTACGSHDLHENGFSVTNVSKFQRYKCENCGSFSRGRKNLLTIEDRDKLLTSIASA